MNRVILMGRLTRDPEVRYTQGERSMAVARYQTGSYTNKEGQRVYTTDIIVDDQEFADSKNSAGGNGDNGGYGYQPTSRPAPTSAIGDGFMNIPDGVEDEGLPFN